MSIVFAPDILATAASIAAQPEVVIWASGWVAAALGAWLRVTLTPADDGLDLAVLEAMCC